MVGGMGLISVPSSCSMRYLQAQREGGGQGPAGRLLCCVWAGGCTSSSATPCHSHSTLRFLAPCLEHLLPQLPHQAASPGLPQHQEPAVLRQPLLDCFSSSRACSRLSPAPAAPLH